uniref:Uncharacterized protein n=1 Tax=Aegilops tauschii TaxID=37682 RepID=M8BEF7_AEGTA
MSGCGTAAALAAAGGDLEAELTRKRVQRVVAVEQPLLIPLNLPELCPEGLPGHRILRAGGGRPPEHHRVGIDLTCRRFPAATSEAPGPAAASPQAPAAIYVTQVVLSFFPGHVFTAGDPKVQAWAISC